MPFTTTKRKVQPSLFYTLGNQSSEPEQLEGGYIANKLNQGNQDVFPVTIDYRQIFEISPLGELGKRTLLDSQWVDHRSREILNIVTKFYWI